jgi:hypothetical protein
MHVWFQKNQALNYLNFKFSKDGRGEFGVDQMIQQKNILHIFHHGEL